MKLPGSSAVASHHSGAAAFAARESRCSCSSLREGSAHRAPALRGPAFPAAGSSSKVACGGPGAWSPLERYRGRQNLNSSGDPRTAARATQDERTSGSSSSSDDTTEGVDEQNASLGSPAVVLPHLQLRRIASRCLQMKLSGCLMSCRGAAETDTSSCCPLLPVHRLFFALHVQLPLHPPVPPRTGQCKTAWHC